MFRTKRAVHRILVAFAAVMLLYGLMISYSRADAPAQTDGKTTQAMLLLDQGVKHFRAGEYGDAGRSLDQLLALQPDPVLALMLREKAGIDQLIAMLPHKEVEAQAYKLIMMSEQEAQRLRADTENIQNLIKKLTDKDLAERLRAERELVACGEYAVPYLLMLMDVEQESAFGWTREERLLARAYAFRTLDDMGVRAVMPLIEALHCDNAGLKVEICGMLEKAGDARAIPALKAVAEDKSQPARMTEAAASAANALSEKAGLPATRTAAEAYLTLAESYYYSDPRVIDYVPGLERTIWSWNPNGKTYSERITCTKAPQYAYNEWMTEKLIGNAPGIGDERMSLQAYLAKTPRLPAGDIHRDLAALFIANRYCEMEEDRAIAAGKLTVGGEPAPAEVKAAAAKRADELEASRPNLRLIGSPELHDALSRFLKDADYAQAKDCIEDIRTLADSTIPESEDALLKAIYAPVPTIRYAATEALLKIAPDGSMGGQVQVVANVIAVCSAKTIPGVAVITTEDKLFTALATALGHSGYQAVRLAGASEVSAHASTELPFVSVVVIDARTQTQDQLAALVGQLDQDPTTQLLPVILLAPLEDVPNLKAEFGKKVDEVLSADADATEIADAIARVMTATAPPEEKTAAARQRLLDTLDNLAGTPPMTLYPTTMCAPAVAALMTRTETDAEIRLHAIKALAAIASPVAFDPLVDLFLDGTASADARVAAGQAAVAVMLASNGKVAVTLDEKQRAGVLALAQKADTSAELRALATQLFTFAPEGRPAPLAPQK